MGRIDNLTKEIFSRPTYFADAVNLKLGASIPLVRAENLRPLNTNDVIIPYGGHEVPDFKAVKAIQRYRDALNLATIMTDDHATYVILGVEVQTNPNVAMPVKVMVYDATGLARQVQLLGEMHCKQGDKLNSTEFLSGMTLSDRLKPIITIVVYLSSEPWKGPQTLKELYGEIDPRLEPFVQDFKIFVLSPSELSDAQLLATPSQLGEILGTVKYESDPEGLGEFIRKSQRYSNLDAYAALLIRELIHLDYKIVPKKGSVNMCAALEKWRIESENRGIEKGIEKGIQKGIGKGIGIGEDRLANLFRNLLSAGRQEEMVRCLNDATYRAQLMREYQLI